MDFTELASGAAALAMQIAGDAKTTATLHIGKTQTYDFTTDATTPSGGSDPVVQGIFYQDKQQQGIDTTKTLATFMIEGADVPAGIDEADSLTIGATKWEVYEVDRIPTDAIYLLRIRK